MSPAADLPERLRAVATLAARAAAGIQKERMQGALVVEQKGLADITTDVDRDCEAAIASIIAARFPEHGVLGEEGTNSNPSSEFLWIVDPLDGTKNYAHGYLRSCVSIGLAQRGVVVLGVVMNPHTGELFVAQNGRGATCNGEPIAVSRVATIDRAMVASALAYDGRRADRAQLERLARVLEAAEAVRSDGCAALDLCDVACGRLDAFFECGLRPWDTAAGTLIVREAGGRVTTFAGDPHDPDQADMVASNGRFHVALVELLA